MTDMDAGAASSIVLADGRSMAYAEYGDPAGRPLLALHGTPGSRLTFGRLDATARVAGVRVIATDRPGYGLSSPRPNGSFLGHADDIRQLLDRLYLDRVTLAGACGGGGFAAAAALRLPARVSRLVLACAMLPGPPAHALAGQSRRTRLLLGLAARARWLVRLAMGAQLRALARRSTPMDERMLKGRPSADRAVLTDAREFALVQAALTEAIRQGPSAAARELALYTGPGLPLGELAVPTVVLHGTADTHVPVGVARWAAGVIPRGRLVEFEGAGHLFLATDPMALLDEVV